MSKLLRAVDSDATSSIDLTRDVGSPPLAVWSSLSTAAATLCGSPFVRTTQTRGSSFTLSAVTLSGTCAHVYRGARVSNQHSVEYVVDDLNTIKDGMAIEIGSLGSHSQ